MNKDNNAITEIKHLHKLLPEAKKANQIGSFICLPGSSGCNGSESSQLKNKAIDEYKITTGIKNHAIEVRDYL